MATAARVSKPTTVKRLTKRKAWNALKVHYKKIGERHLRDLFDDDPERAEKFTAEAVGISLDYSKNRITEKTIRLLLELAEESGLRERIDAMFRGDKINITENRAVLHVALRAPKEATIVVDGKNVVPEVHAVLDRMSAFSNRVRSGAWTGHTGKRIRNVINVGIGGSDLGPVMAYEALKHYSERGMTFRFVSNIDGTDFAEAVVDLDPSVIAIAQERGPASERSDRSRRTRRVPSSSLRPGPRPRSAGPEGSERPGGVDPFGRDSSPPSPT